MSVGIIIANVVSVIFVIVWIVNGVRGLIRVNDEIHEKNEVMNSDEKHTAENSAES